MISTSTNPIPWIWCYSYPTPYGDRTIQFTTSEFVATRLPPPVGETCVTRKADPAPITPRPIYSIGASSWRYNPTTRNVEISALDEKVACSIFRVLRRKSPIDGAAFLWKPIRAQNTVQVDLAKPKRAKKKPPKIDVSFSLDTP